MIAIRSARSINPAIPALIFGFVGLGLIITGQFPVAVLGVVFIVVGLLVPLSQLLPQRGSLNEAALAKARARAEYTVESEMHSSQALGEDLVSPTLGSRQPAKRDPLKRQRVPLGTPEGALDWLALLELEGATLKSAAASDLRAAEAAAAKRGDMAELARIHSLYVMAAISDETIETRRLINELVREQASLVEHRAALTSQILWAGIGLAIGAGVFALADWLS